VEVVAVLGGNVPLIWPWVNRDALRAESFGIECKLEHIWGLAAASIAQCCDFIDIHAESGHGTIIELQKYETFK
jgi:hypothetical protein